MNERDIPKGSRALTSLRERRRLQLNITHELYDRASALAEHHGVTLARFVESILASATTVGEQARAAEAKKPGG